MPPLAKERWVPQEKQDLFLRCPAYEAGFGGTKGPGKTDALIVDGTGQIGQEDYKAILFRRTHKQLEEIYIRTTKFFQHVGAWNGEKKCWLFPNRARYYLSHCQHEIDKYNHQGQQYDWMGFDQVETFTLTQYQFLMMQVRSANPKINNYIRSTFNPGGVGHSWVRQRFVDACPWDGKVLSFMRNPETDEEEAVRPGTKDALTRAFIFSTIYDNKILLENNPLYLSNLKSLPLAQRKAMLEGDWDSFEGQYFREFTRPVHVVPYAVYQAMAANWPHKRAISLDYGFACPSSVHWHAIFPNNLIVTYRELYEEGLDYEQLALRILKMTQAGEEIEYGVVDPAIQGDKSHHAQPKDGDAKGESGFDVIRRIIGSRWPMLLADNKRVVGWTRMHEYLRPFEDQHGQTIAHWRMTDNCKNLIRTLPGLVHDATNPEDVDSDGEDHAPDDCRYFLMSRPISPRAPEQPKTKGDVLWERVRKDIKKQNISKNGGHDTSEEDNTGGGEEEAGGRDD